MVMKELTIFEEILLTTIWRLKQNAYGVAIRKKVAELTGKRVIYGTLYNGLNQLVQKGYVHKTKGEPTAERGGRSKIYYKLTPNGKKAMQETRQLHQMIWDGIPDLVIE